MKPEGSPTLLELTARSERGDADAQYILGKKYYEGDGVEKDVDRAADLLKSSAESGNPAAQYTFGYMCCPNTRSDTCAASGSGSRWTSWPR